VKNVIFVELKEVSPVSITVLIKEPTEGIYTDYFTKEEMIGLFCEIEFYTNKEKTDSYKHPFNKGFQKVCSVFGYDKHVDYFEFTNLIKTFYN